LARANAAIRKTAVIAPAFTAADVRLMLSSPVYAYGINLLSAERVAEEVMKLNVQFAQQIRFALSHAGHHRSIVRLASTYPLAGDFMRFRKQPLKDNRRSIAYQGGPATTSPPPALIAAAICSRGAVLGSKATTKYIHPPVGFSIFTVPASCAFFNAAETLSVAGLSKQPQYGTLAQTTLLTPEAVVDAGAVSRAMAVDIAPPTGNAKNAATANTKAAQPSPTSK
jgi:hypothetical protein